MTPQTGFSAVHVEPSFDSALTNEIVIGLIALSTDTLTERELRKIVPNGGINFSATRIKHHEPATIETMRRHAYEIANAGELFHPRNNVNVFAYACTSGSAIISQEKLEKELHRTRPGSSLTTPMTGALRAFDKLGVKRVAMLTPYTDNIAAVIAECINNSDVSVCSSASFHLKDEYEIAAISPQSIIEAACSADIKEAEALFIPCTGLRTIGIIDDLEARLGKPVITAHQAMFWDALRLAGYNEPIVGHGRLLTL